MDISSFVLAAATADLADEPAARGIADCIEFRMDLAAEPMAALESYDGELPLLVTNRPTWEGGEADDGGRIDTLQAAMERPFVGAIDVELATIEAGDADALLDRAADASVSVVVSSHDFESTPSSADMRTTLERAARHGDVAKLAVTATTLADTVSLLEVTQECTSDGFTVATMAMGAVGRHTRAVAPIYGSRIGYAPVDPAEATAPGQYDLATLATLVDQLDSDRSKQEP